MLLNRHKVLGILGGMGPEATVDFYNHVIALTEARTDQDHIPTLMYNNAKIPNRTESILSGKTDEIIKYLSETARILERGGADIIAIPCNTAHKFFDAIEDAVTIPVLHIVKETAEYITGEHRDIKFIGILGTDGTLHSKLYHEGLEESSIQLIEPNSDIQKSCVMEGIRIIKAGGSIEEARELFIKAIDSYNGSIDSFILGCTEIPLAFREPVPGATIINPTEILAKRSVEFCKN